MDYKTHILRHEFAGHTFDIECLEDLDKTVDDMFVQLDHLGVQELLEDLCPYFGIVWSAGRALCQWMEETGAPAFTGKRVIELGCGLALPSFLAAKFGAEVAATDLHPDVPKFLERNRQRNSSPPIQFRDMDWRIDDYSNETWDWILASDVLYEKDYAQSLAQFLERRLAPQGRAVVSDPQRPYCDAFEAALKASPLCYKKIIRAVEGCTQQCALFLIQRKV